MNTELADKIESICTEYQGVECWSVNELMKVLAENGVSGADAEEAASAYPSVLSSRSCIHREEERKAL